jgi:hypothetical protein
MLRRTEPAILGRMKRFQSGVLAVAVVMTLSCTGCVRTGEDAARHQARKLALEDAGKVAITREAETGGGLSYATGQATVCVRFELHGDNGSRRVTTREIDCPPSR